eukprot:TRINITY_DN2408_c0_g1_i1.p1 TRINITY_DN2408_c0_g1~~TRINITY_DN2408_c0_g1_i1.p1  ORF type:complete len:739 (-),score=46.72 TRINITY_DN2408_c0_g1_i1:861-3077(-)
MDRRNYRTAAATSTDKKADGKKDQPHPYPSARKSVSKNQRSRKKKKGVECWNCGKIGHTRAECWSKRKSNNNQSNPNSRNGGGRNRQQNQNNGSNRNWESQHGSNHDTTRNDAQRNNRNNNDYDREPRGFIAIMQAKSSITLDTRTWLDCGATHVFVNDRSLFWDYKPTRNQTVRTCDRESEIHGYGTIHLPLGNGLTLPAKHTPSFNSNLVSLSVLSNHVNIQFETRKDFTGFTLKDPTSNEVLYKTSARDGLYPLPNSVPPLRAQNVLPSPGQTAKDWHDKLGHPGKERLLSCPDLCEGLPQLSPTEVSNIYCTPCIEAGSRRAPLQQSTSTASKPLELTHTDLTGPINPPSLQGSRYIQVLLDDNTRVCSVYFLDRKSQFFHSVRWYKARVENELSPNRIYRVRLDGAGENRSDDFIMYAMENGIILEYNPPYAHQSNGAAEKIIQDLWKTARTLLQASQLPLELWEEAISHANYLRNRLPNSRVEWIPFTLWFGQKPDFSNLLKFGQKGHAFIYRSETVPNKKLLPRAIPGHFIGMHSPRTLYRIYIPSMRKVIKCRERDFKVSREQLLSIAELIDLSSVQRSEAEGNINEEDEEHLDAALSHCMVAHSRSKDLEDFGKLLKNFEEARVMPGWAEAIDREYNALVERKTWILVDRKPGMRPLPFLWTFLAKHLSSEPPRILPKARCVVRGDMQRPYLDFDPDNVYAPVARLETIRLAIAKAAVQRPSTGNDGYQ